MEKRYRSAVPCALALCLAAAACREDPAADFGPGGGALRLDARKEETVTRVAGEDRMFDAGVRFRIWACRSGTTDSAEGFPAGGVPGKESLLRGGLHYVSLGEEYNGKLHGPKDFYGLTDNVRAENGDGFLPPDEGDASYRIELDEQSVCGYPDYLRAELPYNGEALPGNMLTLNFRHIMSKVTFKAVQQSDEVIAGENRLKVISVSLRKKDDEAGIPLSGTYDVLTGEFSVSKRGPRLVKPEKPVTVPVRTPGQSDAEAVQVGGPVLIFPSGAERADGIPQYVADITFDDPGGIFGTVGETTLSIPVCDSWNAGNPEAPLEFLPNYRYMLVFNFLRDRDKRVVTLVPQVFDWLEGEGTVDTPGYQEQDLGQPVTFNGVMWADRNLGATSAHPTRSYEDWLKSVGYFYQYGRNIPYFPMPPAKKNDQKGRWIYEDLSDIGILKESLVSGGELTGKNPLFPVVDPASWNLGSGTYYYQPARTTADDECIWNLGDAGGGHTFSFSYDGAYSLGKLERKSNGGETPRTWADQSETPCPPGWRLPAEEDFRGILPGSAYSGNITFRVYTNLNNAGSWEATIDNKSLEEPDFEKAFSEENLKKIKVLEKSGLYDKNEPAYSGRFPYIYRREMEDFGGADTETCEYILSMGDDDRVRVKDRSGELRNNDKEHIYNWGVVYGIKRQGTTRAYRMKWEIELVTADPNPEKKDGVVVYNEPFRGVLVISRYRTSPKDKFTPDADGDYGESLRSFDWDHPAEVLYLPVGGIVNNWTGGNIANVGTETWYATNETAEDNRKKIMWFKFAGSQTASQSIILSDKSPLGDAVQVRCVRDLNADKR